MSHSEKQLKYPSTHAEKQNMLHPKSLVAMSSTKSISIEFQQKEQYAAVKLNKLFIQVKRE